MQVSKYKEDNWSRLINTRIKNKLSESRCITMQYRNCRRLN